MSNHFVMQWKIITGGQERRISDDNDLFEITFDGYQIFPMEEPIDIQRSLDSDQIGSAKVVKLSFSKGLTICQYQLISLYSVN
ncbi:MULTISPECIES: DUF2584 family protein [Allobacillus]|uniref:DUF2584 family protein n=1 Tax=Allobacillus salarius TaxID=1955272 RepID=A0A556PSZ5_9BACI|nr:DUF2584 family protein [Allobacillus salarius]TSJ67515.1 DUF2584 family protein [Allobacillus salarius]